MNEQPKVHMYFIAIVLPEDLNQQVLVYKNYMREDYGCQVGLKSPAHITLVPPFWMEEEKELSLIEEIKTLSFFEPFTLATDNFSAFKPRTIFIALSPSEQLEDLKRATDKTFTARPEYKIKVDTRPFHPHITIATRDLTKKAFHEAWPYFEQKIFTEAWTAEGISLLRHNRRNWEVVFSSRFTGS
jgi:2'-5' RNA ligase